MRLGKAQTAFKRLKATQEVTVNGRQVFTVVILGDIVCVYGIEALYMVLTAPSGSVEQTDKNASSEVGEGESVSQRSRNGTATSQRGAHRCT